MAGEKREAPALTHLQPWKITSTIRHVQSSTRRMKSALSILLIAGLLCGQASSHADEPAPDRTASLDFSIEQHPGKADWISGSLHADGAFIAQGTLHAMRGQLPAQESLRILQEVDQLRLGADEDRFLFHPHLGGGQRRPPWIDCTSPQGKQRRLINPGRQPSPELAEFMRSLWQKLFFHPAATPSPSHRPAAAPPKSSIKFVSPFVPVRRAQTWRKFAHRR